MSWPKPVSATNDRRFALKASLAISAWGYISSAAAAPEVASIFGVSCLSALAQKVESALPREVCIAALDHFKSGLAKLTDNQQPDLLLSLQLLHREDLATGRVHEIHGLRFTSTQVGYLVSVARGRRDGAA